MPGWQAILPPTSPIELRAVADAVAPLGRAPCDAAETASSSNPLSPGAPTLVLTTWARSRNAIDSGPDPRFREEGGWQEIGQSRTERSLAAPGRYSGRTTPKYRIARRLRAFADRFLRSRGLLTETSSRSDEVNRRGRVGRWMTPGDTVEVGPGARAGGHESRILERHAQYERW